jgi:hypothetical protein
VTSSPESLPKRVKPKPVKPWRRAEPGRHRSSDDRFTLESDGGGRWFVTDEAERDELGLARTTGPYSTLTAAKAAADDARDRPAVASPLAAKLADAASRPKRAAQGRARATVADAHREPVPVPEHKSPPRTWLEDLADRDPEAARRARRLVVRLAETGMADADALVRRDVLGDTPAIAARLLAQDLVAAVARLQDPQPADVVEAVAAVLAGSPAHEGLPGWELVERGGPGGRTRRVRIVADDLR